MWRKLAWRRAWEGIRGFWGSSPAGSCSGWAWVSSLLVFPCCSDTHTLVIVLFLFGFNVKKRRLHSSRAMALVNIILQELGVLAHALIDHLQVAVFCVCDYGGRYRKRTAPELRCPSVFQPGKLRMCFSFNWNFISISRLTCFYLCIYCYYYCYNAGFFVWALPGELTQTRLQQQTKDMIPSKPALARPSPSMKELNGCDLLQVSRIAGSKRTVFWNTSAMNWFKKKI